MVKSMIENDDGWKLGFDGKGTWDLIYGAYGTRVLIHTQMMGKMREMG